MRNTGKCKSLDESNISRGGPWYFPLLPVCVYKLSSHYLNNIIFIDNSLWPLATESPCIMFKFTVISFYLILQNIWWWTVLFESRFRLIFLVQKCVHWCLELIDFRLIFLVQKCVHWCLELIDFRLIFLVQKCVHWCLELVDFGLIFLVQKCVHWCLKLIDFFWYF